MIHSTLNISKDSSDMIKALTQEIQNIPSLVYYGRVHSVQGNLIKVHMHSSYFSVGQLCTMEHPDGYPIQAEVVGFTNDQTLIMPYGDIQGIHAGCRVLTNNQKSLAYPSMSWLGRVINALSEPIDHKGPLILGNQSYKLNQSPPPAHQRARVKERLDVGIRSINAFLTCCKGQRMGIFSGSGVGKSTLLSMLARYSASDICVIGLVGERGREVREFIEDVLGVEGLKKSILIVATSDEPALMRRRAAYLTLSIAEYFRDLGLSVLCLVDSVTRFAMAQREIGISVGESTNSKGYPPSVFYELSRLLERAGPGLETEVRAGMMTGFFSVLVEGDDTNEPLCDAVRSILDGHIILDRSIAERGHYPCINILKSVSRLVPKCLYPHEYALLKEAKKWISIYEDMSDLIRLNAYKRGSNPDIDRALFLHPHFQTFLAQTHSEYTTIEETFQRLEAILNL